MLVIPLKVTARYDITPALSNWISSHSSSCANNENDTNTIETHNKNNNNNPLDEFRGDLLRISSLRMSISSSMSTKTCHSLALQNNALQDLSEYAASLSQAEERGIPTNLPNFGTEWKCAFDSGGHVGENQRDLLYERCAVLYNIAALHSYQAVHNNDLGSNAGLSQACKHYSSAAGILNHISKIASNQPNSGSGLRNPSMDMSVVGISMVEKIMLAQGQSCVFEMAKLKNKPMHSVISKIASGAGDIYEEALMSIQNPILRGLDQCSSNTSGWKTGCIKSRMLVFRAYSEYHESIKAKMGKHWGVELGRLGVVEGLIEQAIIFGRKGDMDDADSEGLERFKNLVMQRKDEAHGDNDGVYHETVPKPRDLPPIKGNRLSKCIFPKELLTLPKPLFVGLLPFTAKNVLQKFNNHTNAILDEYSVLCQKESENARNSLAQVYLPQSLSAFASRDGFPNAIWEKVRTMQSHNITESLKGDLWALKDTAEMTRSVLSDISDNIQSDIKLYNEFCSVHPSYNSGGGCQRPQEVHSVVNHDLTHYQDLLENANHGDTVLLNMLETLEVEPKFKLLHMSKGQLENQIPTGSEGAAYDTSTLSELLKELSNLLKQRDIFLSKLKHTKFTYNIKEKLAEISTNSPDSSSEAYESVLRSALTTFSHFHSEIQQNISKQPPLLHRILNENTSFTNARQTDSVTMKRENIIQMIEEGIFAVNTCKSQVAEGLNFYKSIMPRLQQLKQRVSENSVRMAVERLEFEEGTHGNLSKMKQEELDREMAERMAKEAEIGGCNAAAATTQNKDAAVAEKRWNMEGQQNNYGMSHSSQPLPNTNTGTLMSQEESLKAGLLTSQKQQSSQSQLHPSQQLPHPLPPASDVTHRPLGGYVPPNQQTFHSNAPGAHHVSPYEQYTRVDDEKVASLVAMDFDPEKVVAALSKHDNNIEQALNDLLSG